MPAPGDLAQSRRPIDPAAVTRALATPARWRIEHSMQTGSTNADLAARAETGLLEHGTVLVTEEQTAGRGRAGRDWQCPPGAGLMFSVALRLPAVSPERRSWIGAVLGLAVVSALRRVSDVDASLKWPNDVLIDGEKCAGILGEVVGDLLIVGSGINVSLTRGELPRADATSLALVGGALDRAALLAGILDDLGHWCDRWVAGGGDVGASGLRTQYLADCVTVGSPVRLLLPAQRWVSGRVVDVDVTGALVIDDGSGRLTPYTAGDVVHVRRGQMGESG